MRAWHSTFSIRLLVAAFPIVMTGCLFANQPVEWSHSEALDRSAGAQVSVESRTMISPSELEYMRHDITGRVQQVLRGDPSAEDAYAVNVEITRYDEGSKFARFMLIGLGQMYVFGTVEVTQGDPPVVVRLGEFRKQYRIGGIMGAIVGPRDITSKVGEAIAAGLMKAPQ